MPAGRPRVFDKEKALEAAMLVFWRNGYPGTSLSDLTSAMGINKPSLYAAFGNKEQLFMAALEQYISHYNFPIFEKLVAPDQPLTQRLTAYLETVGHMFLQPELPAGCMMANSMSESTGDNMPHAAHQLISEINRRAKQFLVDFFSEEQAKGNLSKQRSPLTLAHYFMSMTSGMAVLSRDGVTAEQLDEMIAFVVSTICK